MTISNLTLETVTQINNYLATIDIDKFGSLKERNIHADSYTVCYSVTKIPGKPRPVHEITHEEWLEFQELRKKDKNWVIRESVPQTANESRKPKDDEYHPF